MADVFISYARPDRAAAKALAADLNAKGLSVWWDANLSGGTAFRDVIETELDSAKAIIVLWTSHSKASRFVQDEADFAAARGRLISVTLNGFLPAHLPLGFRALHSICMDDQVGIDDALARLGVKSKLSQENTPEAGGASEDEDQCERREREAWNFVLSKDNHVLYEEFIKAFPHSRNREFAESRKGGLLSLIGGALIFASVPALIVTGYLSDNSALTHSGLLVGVLLCSVLLYSEFQQWRFKRRIRSED